MKFKKAKKQSFEEKNPEFVGEVAGLSREDLKTRLAKQVQGIRDAEELKKNDSELNECKASLKELNAPHNDTKKELKAKLDYISKLIEEKGGA